MVEKIKLNVNGRIYHLPVDPHTPLLFILRNDLGLKGVKYACGQEQCGACKVIVDGQAVPTCRLPVGEVQGLEITTIEGLGTVADLHPLQEAFVEEGAIQCGYCTSGMITAAQGLLNRRRYPSDDEIRAELETNLCRCGAYDRIRRAIKIRIGRPPHAPVYQLEDGSETLPQPSLTSQPRDFPSSLRRNPDLDSWVRIDPGGSVTIFTGKVEFGQGIRTAFAQIGAEELDVSLARIRVAKTDTAHSPNEGLTVGSMSLETSGNAIRIAAAEARYILLSIAMEELEAPIERLQVADGTIFDPVSGRSTTYWELFAGEVFNRQVTGVAQPKAPQAYTVVGQPVPRIDLPDKVAGEPAFVHDLDLPGMVHGRVLRPPNYAARLVSVDEEAVQKLPGALRLVCDGSFLGVITEREEQAVAAVESMGSSAVWQGQVDLPPAESLYEHLMSQPALSNLIVDGSPVDGTIPPVDAPTDAAHTLRATYYRPYQMHASLGPSAAMAQMDDGQLTIWTHSQGVYPIRAALAHVLGMEEEKIRVVQAEGPGCYGHNGADDAALDAALLARAIPGRPVMLKWTQSDELTWEPYGPAMAIRLQGSINEAKEVTAWNHDVWSYPHLGRSRAGGDTSGLLAAEHLQEPFAPIPRQPAYVPHTGSYRNAAPLYTFPRQRIVNHFVPDSPLRTSAIRGLGAYANVFAIESFVDELAFAAGVDPVEFRLSYLDDERARAVIEAAAQRAGWGSDSHRQAGRGQGIAFAQYKNRQCYAAVIVDLNVDITSGQISLERGYIAADAGQIVNPDGLSSQLEGGFVQSVSWTLKEQVVYDRRGVTSDDWERYPILSFPHAPEIETLLINRPGYPFLGSGEAVQGPAPAAIANAVFDAVGLRLRQIPFTPERVLAALAEKGIV